MPSLPPNVQEVMIIKRKVHRLSTELKMTKGDIEKFFLRGLLPAKMIKQIKDLDRAPEGESMQSFLEMLEVKAKKGCVLALARHLENTNTELCDELLSELDLFEEKLTIDEATLDEAATMIHRDFGTSRKLGPVDQKSLKNLLGGRVVVTRSSSQKKLARLTDAKTLEHLLSEFRDEQAKILVERLRKYTMEKKIGRSKQDQTPARSDRAIIELNHLLEDIFADIKNGYDEIETVTEERERTKEILEAVVKRKYGEGDHLDHVIRTIFQKRRLELEHLKTKLRLAEDRVSDTHLALMNAQEERPAKVTFKTISKDKIQEKLEESETRYSALSEREKTLKLQLGKIKIDIDDQKLKMEFIAKSKTVKSGQETVTLKKRDLGASGKKLSASLTEFPVTEKSSNPMYYRSAKHYTQHQRHHTASSRGTSSTRSQTSEDSDADDYIY